MIYVEFLASQTGAPTMEYRNVDSLLLSRSIQHQQSTNWTDYIIGGLYFHIWTSFKWGNEFEQKSSAAKCMNDTSSLTIFYVWKSSPVECTSSKVFAIIVFNFNQRKFTNRWLLPCNEFCTLRMREVHMNIHWFQMIYMVVRGSAKNKIWSAAAMTGPKVTHTKTQRYIPNQIKGNKK